MPKLMALLACEKVIIDRNSNTPSVISIFQHMNVPVADAPLPEGALAPTKWAIFTLWQHQESERNVDYIQHLQILAPSGETFSEVTASMKITEPDDLQSKNITEIFGIPISREGTMQIRVWLEGNEDAAAVYPFQIRHTRSQRDEQSTENKQQPVN